MKLLAIIIGVFILLATPILAADWDACASSVVVRITNNDNNHAMVEHDINFTVDTTAGGWEEGIYVTDLNDASTRFARNWWNQTSFVDSETIIWTKTNVSAGGSDNDIIIYYDCGGETIPSLRNETNTFYDDFTILDENFWNDKHNNAGCRGFSVTAGGYLNVSGANNDFNGYCDIASNGSSFPDNLNAQYGGYLMRVRVQGLYTGDSQMILTNSSTVGVSGVAEDMVGLGLDARAGHDSVVFKDRDHNVQEDVAEYLGNFDTDGEFYNFTMFFNGTDTIINNENGTNIVNIHDYEMALDWVDDDVNLFLAIGSHPATATVETWIDELYLIKYFEGNSAFDYLVTGSSPAITENNQTYNATVVESDEAYFSINFTYNATYYNQVYANLSYGGTKYGGTNLTNTTVDGTDGTMNDIIFERSITVPEVTADTSKTFYWDITLVNKSNDAISLKSLSYSQNILNIALQFCNGTAGLPVLYNFTIYDELDNTLHNASFKVTFQHWVGSGDIRNNYSFQNISGGDASYLFCYDYEDDVNVDAVIEYRSDGYDIRNYFLVSNLANSNTQNISLYLLGINYANGITFHVTDPAENPYINAYIKVQRYDAGTGTYRLVAMGRTDDEGESYIFLRKYDAWYRFLVDYDQSTVYTSEQSQIKADDIYIKIAETTISTLLEIYDTIAYTLDYADYNYILVYNDASGRVVNGCLRVNRRHQMVLTEICNICEASSSATIMCHAGNSTGSYIATFYIQGSPFKYIAQRIDDITKSLASTVGRDGLIVALILVVSMMLLMIHSPSAALVSGLAGLLFVSALGFVAIPSVIIGGLIIVVMILIFKIKK